MKNPLHLAVNAESDTRFDVLSGWGQFVEYDLGKNKIIPVSWEDIRGLDLYSLFTSLATVVCIKRLEDTTTVCLKRLEDTTAGVAAYSDTNFLRMYPKVTRTHIILGTVWHPSKERIDGITASVNTTLMEHYRDHGWDVFAEKRFRKMMENER